MTRLSVVSGWLIVGLLFGCQSAPPTEATSTSAPPEETSMPAPAEPSEAVTPAPLDVNSFSINEVLAKAGSGCSALFEPSADDENYVLYEGIELALMKVEGDWVEFSHDEGSEFGNPAVRSFTSRDGLYKLTLDAPLGERTGYEVTNIPEATIELQLVDEPVTTLTATGEIGC